MKCSVKNKERKKTEFQTYTDNMYHQLVMFVVPESKTPVRNIQKSTEMHTHTHRSQTRNSNINNKMPQTVISDFLYCLHLGSLFLFLILSLSFLLKLLSYEYENNLYRHMTAHTVYTYTITQIFLHMNVLQPYEYINDSHS